MYSEAKYFCLQRGQCWRNHNHEYIFQCLDQEQTLQLYAKAGLFFRESACPRRYLQPLQQYSEYWAQASWERLFFHTLECMCLVWLFPTRFTALNIFLTFLSKPEHGRTLPLPDVARREGDDISLLSPARDPTGREESSELWEKQGRGHFPALTKISLRTTDSLKDTT